MIVLKKAVTSFAVFTGSAQGVIKLFSMANSVNDFASVILSLSVRFMLISPFIILGRGNVL
nr:MAG TPA: hypothetical protein [Caudoviricetes sp.]